AGPSAVSGLHLLGTPAGGKHWRFRDQFGGQEKLLAIGSYPELSLADARLARDEAKATARGGRDPSAVKRQKELLSRRRAARPSRPSPANGTRCKGAAGSRSTRPTC
ncbi:Arm DNA-binding domain-containing protein, partial [Enterovirga sp.]|uniref:Arm DNA-binding domain-containing protein n=1 Tax=Enterovirga sp. TaxID=2026350 RepID=UPI0034561363